MTTATRSYNARGPSAQYHLPAEDDRSLVERAVEDLALRVGDRLVALASWNDGGLTDPDTGYLLDLGIALMKVHHALVVARDGDPNSAMARLRTALAEVHKVPCPPEPVV
jgi:hypothetical protein